MLTKISVLFLFPFFCCSASIPVFLPPANWHAAQPKGLTSTLKVGFVGESVTNFRPSINLSTEKVDCTLKEYLKAVKEIHTFRAGTSWRDLGSIEMKAGTGRITEIRTSEMSMLQAIYLHEGVAYILTAAMAKEDFLSYQKQILTSMKSLELVPDLWSAVKEENIRDRIASLIETKDWRGCRQLIEKETSSMGEYWQFLALQEVYGKISK